MSNMKSPIIWSDISISPLQSDSPMFRRESDCENYLIFEAAWDENNPIHVTKKQYMNTFKFKELQEAMIWCEEDKKEPTTISSQ